MVGVPTYHSWHDSRLGVARSRPRQHPRSAAALSGLDGGPSQCRLTTGQELLLRELGRINSELASQRRLNAMTVHDLSSPAQVILGLSEVLLEHQVLDPMVRRHLEQLHRSAVTMTALITDLSHGFSLDDTESLELERLDLVELVTSVVERTHLLAEAKDMKLLLFADQPDHRACWIDGDSVRLERAMVNLLGNAIKFSPPGSSVSVAARARVATSPRCRSATRARASARTARPASSRSSSARRRPRTCPASVSVCSSPSRSRRATAAP